MIGALLTPVWFVICWLLSILEEEKLVNEYGEQYKHYQEKTPKLIPFSDCCNEWSVSSMY